MTIRTLQNNEYELYEQWLSTKTENTLWQSLEWKNFQENLGRTTEIFVAENSDAIIGSALVVKDKTTFGLEAWEVSRGPIVESPEVKKALLAEIEVQAKKSRCMVLYCSPLSDIELHGWKPSNRLVFGDYTRIVNLEQSEKEILKQMKQKGRYNIKVSEKKGVTVLQSDNLEEFIGLMAQTSKRDGFTAQKAEHYRLFLKTMPSFLLMAYNQEQQPIAGLIGVLSGSTGIYYYGASLHEYRSLMAPYALQWHAMQYCKGQGCTKYDLLGIAPPNEPKHPWVGISAFKEKFGGEVAEYPKEVRKVLKPLVFFGFLLKRFLWKR